ncbi:ras GTPase-activating protein-binding protein 2 [Neltuma alba]|uniref:ras GTPase-activating protein-binding protein 2 n=1 Tax=Neltuma alba TaxID=207710 RepID=UPI0010A2B3DD|nr:ras GTPase-activating protein-binding protein 2-like [Prosopis alba]
MAMEAASHPTTPSAEMVGNAFVEQYYHILHHSPELVYRFYQESSVLSRPDSNGVMASVTTMKGINEKILSLNFKDFKAEIKTADAQKSHNDGVTVLVTGSLTGKDDLRRPFAQSFFLAPQDNGYFVLNDVFRYLEQSEPSEQHSVNVVDDAIDVLITSDPDPSHVSDPSAPDAANSHANKDQNGAENAYVPSNLERQSLVEIEGAEEPQSQSNGVDVSQATELASSAQEDTPKKSYASILKVLRGSSEPNKVYVPTKAVKVVPKKIENQSVEPVESAAAPEPEREPNSVNVPESSNNHEEVEGYSIYIRNLPMSVTASQLEVEFKRFGPIKQGGIQVRNNKQQGYCFGFVEFLSPSAMNSAIQASPITFGGRQAEIEMKRTTTRVGAGGAGRGRFPPARGGFRNDFRGRGFGGGRGFNRNDYGNPEFSGRGRGPGNRGSEGYHQGRGRGGRSSGQRHNTLSS